MVDEHGQPLRRYNSGRVEDRVIDELIGLCRGILADGAIVKEEADFLLAWLQRNREFADCWPLNVLYQRVREALADGVLDADEERELLQTLMEIAGAPVPLTAGSAGSMSTELPLDNPPPLLEFQDRVYCFTGRFAAGTRREVEDTVLNLGAEVCKTPALRTDYLVIGSAGSRDWIYRSHLIVEFRKPV
jgi:hypothetical protein